MYAFLLTIIYIAFLSLGLPDSLLGSAWPAMQTDLNVPLSYAGIVSMIITSGTIVSSLLSERLTKKFGTGLLTAASVFLTAAALLGFSVSSEFWMLCLWAVPFGLGAGATDAALNNFVAIRYESSHMNWLHCFWGVGAAISPYVMGFSLTGGLGWTGGFRTIFFIQATVSVLLFASLPLWRKNKIVATIEEKKPSVVKLSEILKLKGVKFVLPAFFAYCEATTGLWASSFLVSARGLTVETAAQFASFFYLGITCGRFLVGFFSNKISGRKMIRLGIIVIFAGLVCVVLPLATEWVAVGGLIVVGLGCAPVYPSIIHATPKNFGQENSQAVIGVQMASAYAGSTVAPPLFGLIASLSGISFLPFYLLIFASVLLIFTELLNKAVSAAAVDKLLLK